MLWAQSLPRSRRAGLTIARSSCSAAGRPDLGFVPPATVAGVARASPQRGVQDVLAVFFMITERQYAMGNPRHAVGQRCTEPAQSPRRGRPLARDPTLARTATSIINCAETADRGRVTNLSRYWPVFRGRSYPRVDRCKPREYVARALSAVTSTPTNMRVLLLDAVCVGVDGIGVGSVNSSWSERTTARKQFEVGRARVTSSSRPPASPTPASRTCGPA